MGCTSRNVYSVQIFGFAINSLWVSTVAVRPLRSGRLFGLVIAQFTHLTILVYICVAVVYFFHYAIKPPIKRDCGSGAKFRSPFSRSESIKIWSNEQFTHADLRTQPRRKDSHEGEASRCYVIDMIHVLTTRSRHFGQLLNETGQPGVRQKRLHRYIFPR